MWSVYRRMAELWNKAKNGKLSGEESTELKHCLDAHMKLALEMANLENLSFVAVLEENHDWLHEICAGIDNLQNKMIGLPYDEKKSKKRK